MNRQRSECYSRWLFSGGRCYSGDALLRPGPIRIAGPPGNYLEYQSLRQQAAQQSAGGGRKITYGCTEVGIRARSHPCPISIPTRSYVATERIPPPPPPSPHPFHIIPANAILHYPTDPHRVGVPGAKFPLRLRVMRVMLDASCVMTDCQMRVEDTTP